MKTAVKAPFPDWWQMILSSIRQLRLNPAINAAASSLSMANCSLIGLGPSKASSFSFWGL